MRPVIFSPPNRIEIPDILTQKLKVKNENKIIKDLKCKVGSDIAGDEKIERALQVTISSGTSMNVAKTERRLSRASRIKVLDWGVAQLNQASHLSRSVN